MHIKCSISTLYNLCKNGFANKLIRSTKNSEAPIIIDGMLKLQCSILLVNKNAQLQSLNQSRGEVPLSLKKNPPRDLPVDHHHSCPKIKLIW